jgi:hypothetical protein
VKWKTKPEPQNGDIRHRDIFAIFPVVTKFEGVEYTVWLETFRVREKYHVFTDRPELNHWRILERMPLFGEHEVP